MTAANTPDISIIIPCRKHARELHDCLAGCRNIRLKARYEIIVVDSAADPGVLSTCLNFPEIRLIRSDRDLDAASARNLGVRHARADCFAFLDSDCIPDQQWLSTALDGLAGGMMMVGGPVEDALPFHPVASADNLLQFADLCAQRPEGRIEVLPACNLGVRKEAFDAIGGFPVAAFMEDVLFTSRAATLWPDRCRFLSNMRVFHQGRKNLAAFWTHHHIFGCRRGLHGFRITQKQQSLGRFLPIVPFVALSRLNYITRRILQWNRRKSAFYLTLLPLIFFGLTGWALGFRQGCKMAFSDTGTADRNKRS